MSARDVIISEIKIAPEPLVQEVYDFILSRKGREARVDGRPQYRSEVPDFIARQKTLFGNRVVADSQGLLDELRAERH